MHTRSEALSPLPYKYPSLDIAKERMKVFLESHLLGKRWQFRLIQRLLQQITLTI